MALSPNARAAAALLGMAAVGAGLYQIAMHVSLVDDPPAFLVALSARPAPETRAPDAGSDSSGPNR